MELTKENIELNQRIKQNEFIIQQLRDNFKATATELSDSKNEIKLLREELN